MPPPAIRVCSSDMARFTGHNPYVSLADSEISFWKRNPKLATWLGREKIEEKDEIVCNVKNLSQEDRERLSKDLNLSEEADVATIAHKIRKDVVQYVAQARSTKEADKRLDQMDTTVKTLLLDCVKQESQKERGTLRETAAIENTEKQTGRIIDERNDKFYTKRMFTLNSGEYTFNVILTGKIDGKFADSHEIVEMKERRNRLFHKVVDYERVQLHCYMVLTNENKSTLIETFNGDSLCHQVEFDAEFWNDCLEKLEAFLTHVL